MHPAQPAPAPARRDLGAILIPALNVLLLTTVVVAMALYSHHWAVAQAQRTPPGEGYYWAVAQYQIAHQRLKQELRAIAAGEPADAALLTQRAAVFASKASILTEPSEVRTLLASVPGFDAASARIAKLHALVGPMLDHVPFQRVDAQQVLAQLGAADDDAMLGQLGNDVRQAELVAKDALLGTLRHRLAWVWAGFGLCWAVLALWLLSAVHSARRYARLAHERQAAVEAMDQAVSTKRKFLNMVSHELRSPLQSIVTAAESLALDLALRQERPQSATALRRIQNAVVRLQSQLRDLLTIARSDTAGLATQVEAFDCAELVRDVCGDLRAAASAKGLALDVNVPDVDLTVEADPIRIAQVLRNLVENAILHTHQGRVDVRLRLLDAPASNPQAPRLQFKVSDTGPGLPLAALSRLRQGAISGTKSESLDEGTRIGLIVVREVLHQLSGTIDVSSQPTLGTVITVEVPVTSVNSPAIPARPPANMEAEALQVLLVDDDPEVLASLSEAASRLGHRCDVAGSAALARTMLANLRYDVILIDLEMPVTDGLALATEIRTFGLTASPDAENAGAMLILISAPENRRVGLEPPFDGFLPKPISAQALAGLIGSRTRH